MNLGKRVSKWLQNGWNSAGFSSFSETGNMAGMKWILSPAGKMFYILLKSNPDMTTFLENRKTG